jgi:predicted dehydrogenase
VSGPERTLRAGVIGCGVGASHAFAYANSPEFDLVAVCDVDPNAFGRFYERSGVTRGSVREYGNHATMLAQEELDVVSIATPDDHHTEPVCAASEAGVKGILCEKPLASSLLDADRIIATCRRNGTRLSVDHTRSWYPQFQAVRAAVRDGAIGSVTRVSARLGGRRAMLFRNGTHLVDALCYFAEAEPVWVIAAHERGFEGYGPVYKGEGGKDPMLDPGSTLIVEFANGIRGTFDAAKNTPAIVEVDVTGTNGRYLISAIDGAAWTTEAPEGPPIEAAVPWTSTAPSNLGENLVPAVRELGQMVWHDAPSSSPPERSRDVLEILFGALQSQSQDSAKIRLPLPRA